MVPKAQREILSTHVDQVKRIFTLDFFLLLISTDKFEIWLTCTTFFLYQNWDKVIFASLSNFFLYIVFYLFVGYSIISIHP